jgi:hypothetical protein
LENKHLSFVTRHAKEVKKNKKKFGGDIYLCPLPKMDVMSKKSDLKLDAIFSRDLNMLASAVRNPRFGNFFFTNFS